MLLGIVRGVTDEMLAGAATMRDEARALRAEAAARAKAEDVAEKKKAEPKKEVPPPVRKSEKKDAEKLREVIKPNREGAAWKGHWF